MGLLPLVFVFVLFFFSFLSFRLLHVVCFLDYFRLYGFGVRGGSLKQSVCLSIA